MYVVNLWEKADHDVASSAGHLFFFFFFWMEVVSHLSSEACSKIIAQTAVAERRKQDSGMQKGETVGGKIWE